MRITLQAELTKGIVKGNKHLSLGNVSEYGKDIVALKRVFAESIRKQLMFSNIRRWYKAKDGTLFVLSYCNGWLYDIMDSARDIPCTVMLGAELDLHEASQKVQHHCNTYCS